MADMHLDPNNSVKYDRTGWHIVYTIDDEIQTENISDEAMKVLRWFWKNIEAND